jgi:hypothetical protein
MSSNHVQELKNMLPQQLVSFLALTESERAIFLSMSETERRTCLSLQSSGHVARFVGFSSQLRELVMSLLPHQIVSFLNLSDQEINQVNFFFFVTVCLMH